MVYIGNSGLARLANTARGEEGAHLVDGGCMLFWAWDCQVKTNQDTTTAASIPSKPATPPPASSSTIHQPVPTPHHQHARLRPEVADRRSAGPSTPLSSRPVQSDSVPADQADLYRLQTEQWMSMLADGGSGMGAAGNNNDNPFAALLAQMNAAGGGDRMPLGIQDSMDPSLAGSDTGSQDPMAAMLKALSQPPAGGTDPAGDFSSALPPGLASMLGGDGNNNNFGAGGGHFPFFASPPTPPKTWLQRSFPLLHTTAMVALWAFIVFWWEPSLSARSNGDLVHGSSPVGKYGLLIGARDEVKGFRRVDRDMARESRFAILVSLCLNPQS